MLSQHEMPGELQFERARLNSQEAADRFSQAGCLQVANFLPENTVRCLMEELYKFCEANKSSSTKVLVGEKRHMFPVPVTGAFSNRELFASAELRSFFTRTLGKNFLLNCLVCVKSEPGAPKQHVHRDYEGLFGHAVDYFSPSFAINLFIPLVPLDEQSGTTRVWPYSHRKADFDAEKPDHSFVDPCLPLGSALLLDYRVMHRGMDNHSSTDRPVLCLAFSRDWFVDRRNFNQANPLHIDAEVYNAMPLKDRELFSSIRSDNALKSD